MKTRLALMLLAFLMTAFSVMAQDEQAFLSILPDVPLIEGLSEIENESLAFDKPEGRIVMIEAQGNVQTNTILGFYEQVLPELGWTQEAYDTYTRGDEVLKITALSPENSETEQTQVKFLLEPRR